MAEEQLVANKNTITIQATTFDFDMNMIPDDDWWVNFQQQVFYLLSSGYKISSTRGSGW